MALIDFTLSNARRFYLSMGNPLGWKGLTLRNQILMSFGHHQTSIRILNNNNSTSLVQKLCKTLRSAKWQKLYLKASNVHYWSNCFDDDQQNSQGTCKENILLQIYKLLTFPYTFYGISVWGKAAPCDWNNLH